MFKVEKLKNNECFILSFLQIEAWQSCQSTRRADLSIFFRNLDLSSLMRRLRDLFLLCFAKSIWKCCEVARFDVLGNKTDGRWQTSYRRLSPRQGWKLQNLSRNFYAWEVKSFPILSFFLLADQEVDQIAESLTNLDSRPDRRSKLWKMNKLVSDLARGRPYL